MSNKLEQDQVARPTTPAPEPREVPLSEVKSPALDRLIAEVRIDEASCPNAYNRFHHRHNR